MLCLLSNSCIGTICIAHERESHVKDAAVCIACFAGVQWVCCAIAGFAVCVHGPPDNVHLLLLATHTYSLS